MVHNTGCCIAYTSMQLAVAFELFKHNRGLESVKQGAVL